MTDDLNLRFSRFVKFSIPCKLEILLYLVSLRSIILTASSSAWLKVPSVGVLSKFSVTYVLKISSGKVPTLISTSPASACTIPIPNGRFVKKMINARTKPKIFVFLIFINFISFLIYIFIPIIYIYKVSLCASWLTQSSFVTNSHARNFFSNIYFNIIIKSNIILW